MTASNRNIFRVTGLLREEFTGDRLNKWLSKQSWGWWFETPLCLLWRHRYEQGQCFCLCGEHHHGGLPHTTITTFVLLTITTRPNLTWTVISKHSIRREVLNVCKVTSYLSNGVCRSSSHHWDCYPGAFYSSHCNSFGACKYHIWVPFLKWVPLG